MIEDYNHKFFELIKKGLKCKEIEDDIFYATITISKKNVRIEKLCKYWTIPFLQWES